MDGDSIRLRERTSNDHYARSTSVMVTAIFSKSRTGLYRAFSSSGAEGFFSEVSIIEISKPSKARTLSAFFVF